MGKTSCFYDQFIKERVLVTGCFDLFHYGHLYFLESVYHAYVGSQRELHVGIVDDSTYAYLKGRKPYFPLEQRRAMLDALKIVEKTHVFQCWEDVPQGTKGVEDGHRQLIERVQPALFVDSRQKPKERIGALPYLKEAGVPIKFVDSIDLHSSYIKTWLTNNE